MLNLNDLMVDAAATTGNKFIIKKITPYSDWADGHRVDGVAGYAYSVVLPERHFEDITVRVPGDRTVDEAAEERNAAITFTGLTIRPYVKDGKGGISCKATEAKLVGGKSN